MDEVQSKAQSVVNKMGCDLLYNELLSEFKYGPDMCKKISRGMIDHGDRICCNCDEDHDILVNDICQTIRHDGDLIVYRIHVDNVHSDPPEGGCRCLQCLSDSIACQAVGMPVNICFELSHNSEPKNTLASYRQALCDKVSNDEKFYVLHISLGVKILDVITNAECITYSLCMD